MAFQNYFRSNAVNEIIKTIKENPGINFDKLVNKLGVNPPFIKEIKAKELIRGLIIDEQLSVNSNGDVNLCSKK